MSGLVVGQKRFPVPAKAVEQVGQAALGVAVQRVVLQGTPIGRQGVAKAPQLVEADRHTHAVRKGLLVVCRCAH